jgi:predicted transcriptional regulator
MKLHKWGEIRRSAKDPVRDANVRHRALAEVFELNIAALREAAGITQSQLAEAAQMTQGEVSTLENRDDFKLSSLRRYVKAAGGKLEIAAVVRGKRVVLHGM